MAFAAARMIRDNQMRERERSSTEIPIPARARGGSKVSIFYIYVVDVVQLIIVTSIYLQIPIIKKTILKEPLLFVVVTYFRGQYRKQS